MNIRDAFSANTIAINRTEVASNRVPYLGVGFFPAKKKMGLDLKWIKTHKGLPVSLMPSNFDSRSTIRSRSGFKMEKTEMAFFRESMLVTEQDEQEMMRVSDTTDPYAQDVLRHIYDDANALIDAADVVPERMRMQLLAPVDGHPKISIEADGVTYEYDYDPNNEYSVNNFKKISGSTDQWSDTENSDPIKDTMDAQDACEAYSGTRPTIMLISKNTMNLLKKNKKITAYVLAQNITANVIMTDARVKEVFNSELGIRIVVYSKQYKKEDGTTEKFYPDGFATLLPEGTLGNTWYGTTPEERTLMGSEEADVKIINTGVTVSVTTTNDPANTKTTVSEIVLPSYERMDETYVIYAYGNEDELSVMSEQPTEKVLDESKSTKK